ncbi:hypothetical protein CDV31_012997 [Fusarium ambrosium]|uniref:Uncharacterized protein n=1 Tax=Fusarium ambrosium TaxID=131363 RepID=A0A428T652_9HYPO|nr:hypothetical protein CDV31_012997 [Fusarium ambrosium]
MSGLPEPWEISIPVNQVPNLPFLTAALGRHMTPSQFTVRVEGTNYSIRGHVGNPSNIASALRQAGAWQPTPQPGPPPRDPLTPEPVEYSITRDGLILS